MNFSTTNDVIGGNSGSPVIDREGRVSGLIFDGNIYSLGGDYGFDASVNRAVAVHSAALLESLDKVQVSKPASSLLRWVSTEVNSPSIIEA